MATPDVSDCTCLRLEPREHLLRWHARAAPVIQRLVQHGHGVDTFRMLQTIALIMKVERGRPECFADYHREHSHHLPDCPFAWRNRGTKRA